MADRCTIIISVYLVTSKIDNILMCEIIENAVNIVVNDSFPKNEYIHRMISEMFTMARKALVELGNSSICVATFDLSESDLQITSRQSLSREDLQCIKNTVRENLHRVSNNSSSLVNLPCAINGQSEERYNLYTANCKILEHFVVPISIQNISLGLLYVGNYDESLNFKKVKILNKFSKYFSRALRHLWHFNIRQKEKFELMLSRVIDGVLLCDPNKNIKFINSSAKRILGLTDDKNWIGEPLINLNNKFLDEYLDEAKQEGIFELNKVAKKSEQKPQLLGVHIEMLKSDRNIEIGWMIILRDVTKNWQNDQMRSALSVASHEIKTPLGSILGAVDLLLEKDLGEINKQQRVCLNIIKDDIGSLNRLLTDILDLSRFDEGVQFLDRRKQIALGLMVNKVIEAFKQFAKSKNIKIENNIPKSIPTFNGHRDRLHQVLANIVENAIKYTMPGGRVTINAELIDSSLTISIQDTGVGIPTAELTSIFSRFKQLDYYPEDGKQGYGLGLSISKEIIEAMGGKIWAESELGVGSIFHIKLSL